MIFRASIHKWEAVKMNDLSTEEDKQADNERGEAVQAEHEYEEVRPVEPRTSKHLVLGSSAAGECEFTQCAAYGVPVHTTSLPATTTGEHERSA